VFFAAVGTDRIPISDGLVGEANLAVYRVRGPARRRRGQAE
jgi:hypothetical protein